MKTQNIIRLLAGLSFLIFFCPFFQMCSDDMMLKKNTDTEEQITMKKERMTANAYELSVFRKIDSHDTQEISWIDTFFTFIIISSAVIFAKSLKTYSFSINILCYLNLLVAFGFVITAFIVALLDDITQIKFGYYLFIINTFAILALQKSVDDAQ